MRSFFLWVFLGILVGAFAGCADGVVGQGATGELTTKLVIGSNIDITEINFTISGNGVDTITGTVPVVSNPVELKVSGIPVGSGYTITLATADGVCTGTATFSVVENQTTAVTVPIQCSDTPPKRGDILVNGEFLLCPTITAMMASPVKAAVGGTIQVNAIANDLGQGTLTYVWTATSDGTYADPALAKTTYTCKTAGTKTLTVTVKNDLSTNCTDSLSIDVTCGTGGGPVCGDGKVEGAEQCDPPAAGTCSDTCQIIGVPCGNGVMDSGELCDPAITSGTGACPTSCNDGNKCTTDTLTGSAAACTAKCTNTAIVPCCGNNTIETGEQCDPPVANACSDTCQKIEQCDDITGTWIAHLNTTGSITQPIGVIPGAEIDYILRLYNRKEGGNLVSTIEICELAASASASGLVTSYSDAVIKTFTVSGSIPDFCAKVGKPVTIPTFQILSGTKSAILPTGNTSPCSTNTSSTCDAAPDSDGDGKYGITVTTTLGALNVSAYTGLVITISLNDIVLDNATTISGTASLANDGFIWGTSLVIGTGQFKMTPDSNAIPVESYLLPGHGEVLCSQVLTHCTTGPTGVCTP